MREPTIQANENLVLNGDFTRSFSGWNKGETNPQWLSVQKELYLGEMTSFLSAGNESSVSQEITIPVDSGADARYILSFLCEVRHTRSGWLRIKVDGSPEDELVIELRPGLSRNVEHDQARLANGQPLEFLPIEYAVELDTLTLKSEGKIQISVCSPVNDSSDPVSSIRITRIKLDLCLAPVQMQTLVLDEQTLEPDRTLHLCLGASECPHSFGCMLKPGNVWVGTKGSLTLDANPQGAIVAGPGWGVDHPLDLTWHIDCPLIGDQEPYLFKMKLFNQYTADAYEIEVSLGHHRLIFKEELEPAYYPVLEYGQTVRLGVQVASYYTCQSLAGRTVSWTVAGQGGKSAVVTNADGWAYFEYKPEADGDYVIEASVESPYYAKGDISSLFDVRVLATDPWKDVLAVVGDDEAPWWEKIGYPNRGTDYPVQVKLPDGSPLLGTEISLRWRGDSPEQLGVSVSPPLEEPMLIENGDATWTLRSEDRLDGRFELSLVCSKLLLPSPKKAMSLARNVVRIGDVREANKFPVIDENESVLLRVQVVHDVVSGDGDAVINALVEWMTPDGAGPTVTTGDGGWASLLYTPTSAGDQVVIASVKAHSEAVAIERQFEVKTIASSPWKNEVRILLDDVEVDRVSVGMFCWRGQSHTLKVTPLSGSSLIGKPVTLDWRGEPPEIGLVPSDIGVPRTLPEEGLEWTLDAQTNPTLSGMFELKLSSDLLASDRELFGRLVSTDLTEEFSVLLDQVPATLGNKTLYPCMGASHDFTVLSNALSPLVGLSTTLKWTGSSPEELDAKVTPDLDAPQTIGDGGVRWVLDFTTGQRSGYFALGLVLPQLELTLPENNMELWHHKVRIETWREAAIDPVVGQDSARMWVQVFSHFTGRPVDQLPVTWLATGKPSVVCTDAEGWSGFAFAPTVAGEHPVEVTVASRFDGYEDTRQTLVKALASDPWAEVMIGFDDQPPQPWGKKTYFPRRKGQHKIQIRAADNSPLFGHGLALGLTGTGPDELGIRFASGEALGASRWFPEKGIEFTFDAGDLKDGSFALRLAAERLANLSPANAMSLGSSAQVMRIERGANAGQVLDWGQELVEQVKVVSTTSGKPMAGVTVTWYRADQGSVTSQTDFYGIATVRFKPLTPGTALLTAIVGDELHSDTVWLPFTLNEPRAIDLSEPIDSRQPPDESVAHARAKVVSPLTGLPLAGIEVAWDYAGSTLEPSLTDGDGIASLTFTLTEEGGQALWATVKGGVAGWDTARLLYGGSGDL